MVVSALKVVAIILIVAGIAGLVYGKFSYTKATHEVSLGRLDVAITEKRRVDVPLWAGIAAIAAGVMMLVIPKRA